VSIIIDYYYCWKEKRSQMIVVTVTGRSGTRAVLLRVCVVSLLSKVSDEDISPLLLS
jgi:hypothetical protein